MLLNEKNGSITFNFNTVKIVVQPITQYNIREVTVSTGNQLIHPIISLLLDYVFTELCRCCVSDLPTYFHEQSVVRCTEPVVVVCLVR